MSRCALIMAGGTGGHVFPALALARRLRDQNWKVVWLGSRAGMETRWVPQSGFPLELVFSAGIRGKGLLPRVRAGAFMVLACFQSLRVILRWRPDVVVGFGGYASFPGGLMAWLLGRPLLIHEQNAIAGLTNRVLGRLARQVFEAFPDSFKAPSTHPLAQRLGKPAQVTWVGNPVREEIAALDDPELRFFGRTGPLQLLVLGGSQGAQALNEVLPVALSQIPVERRPAVLHQSGEGGYEAVRAAYRARGVDADVRSFIDDMADAYGRSDLVVCRAGALTVAELAAVGIASLLVPFPHAVDDHQMANGLFLARTGAAVVWPQDDFEAVKLARWIDGQDRESLLGMARAARTLARPDCLQRLVQACREVTA